MANRVDAISGIAAKDYTPESAGLAKTTPFAGITGLQAQRVDGAGIQPSVAVANTQGPAFVNKKATDILGGLEAIG